jgi:ring-1,2-phenylacetyl-CoA epoxidase subunit PaaE
MARPPLKLDYQTLLLLCAEWILFAGNIVVYAIHPGPLLAHIAISVLAIHLAFTIWHEAAHGTVSNRKWINNAVGILGMFPYTTPYFLQRFVHLDHHKYLNDPDHDPNQIYASGPFWQLPIRYLQTVGYARRMLDEDPRSPAMRASDGFFMALVAILYLVALWQGFFVDLLLLWLLPVVIAKVILDWYVNFLPHVGLPQDRFLGTRIIDVDWLTPLVLGHNYHAVHHLWPTIPWHAYTARYREKNAYLRENGVPIESRLIGGRLYPTLPGPGGEAQPEDAERQEA